MLLVPSQAPGAGQWQSDGTPGGRTFALAEVIDLARSGETERLRAELFEAAEEGPARLALFRALGLED
jgi:hypothetical protein